MQFLRSLGNVQLKVMPIPSFKTKCYQILVSKPITLCEVVSFILAEWVYDFVARAARISREDRKRAAISLWS